MKKDKFKQLLKRIKQFAMFLGKTTITVLIAFGLEQMLFLLLNADYSSITQISCTLLSSLLAI